MINIAIYFSSYKFYNGNDKNNITMLTDNKFFSRELNTIKYFKPFLIYSMRESNNWGFFILQFIDTQKQFTYKYLNPSFKMGLEF
jgi:hypothetical protein